MSIRNYRINNNIKYGTIAFLIYMLNRFLLKSLNLPIISYILKNHFNDFLGGFIFCCYINALLYFSHKKMINNFWILIIFMFLVSISWEFIFPLFLDYSISDWFDVVAYLLGTILYYLLLYKSNNTYNNIIIKERKTKTTN